MPRSASSASPSLQPLPFKSLREMVADRLRQAILDGSLKPGQKILDADVASQMGISRSPVREALRQLEKDGVVRSTPNRGTIVRDLSEADLSQLYGIRSVLEGLAAVWACRNAEEPDIDHLRRLAAEMSRLLPFGSDEDRLAFLRKDFEFHQSLVEASHSPHLAEALSAISLQIRMIMAANSAVGHASAQAAAEHEQMVDTISRRDARAAEGLLRSHVEGAEARLIHALESSRRE